MKKEAEVFRDILGEVNLLRDLSEDFNKGEVTRVAFSRQATKVVARLCESAKMTEAFGIVLPVVEFGVFSRSFWRWFNYWNRLKPREMRRHKSNGEWDKCDDQMAFQLQIEPE